MGIAMTFLSAFHTACFSFIRYDFSASYESKIKINSQNHSWIILKATEAKILGLIKSLVPGLV